jgi:glycosyltransferase involved in cell wall biosynthesis
MKILEINFEKNWRGGERQTLYNMLGFRRAGMTVHLLCRAGSVIESMANAEGFTTLPYKNVWGVIVCLLTKGRSYEFIHSQTSQILTYCILTKPVVRTPVIFTRRVDFVPKGFFTKLKYRSTDKIVGVSNAIKDILAKFTGRGDIETIYDIGIQIEPNVKIAKERLTAAGINGKRIVATTSALTGHKDPFTSIEAIKRLRARRDDFVFLHFGSGELHDEVAAAVRQNELEETYLLMGFVEKVENFFPLFEVFVMTSQEEGLGSSVLDAFLYKVPVVSTNAGGLKELVNSERGIVCNIKDAEGIAQGINLLLERPQEKEKYLTNAFNYVCTKHSMEHITDQYLAVMNTIDTTKT